MPKLSPKRTIVVLLNLLLVDKGIDSFPKVKNLKMNVIVLLEFKFGYDALAVQYFSQYATVTPPKKIAATSSILYIIHIWKLKQ